MDNHQAYTQFGFQQQQQQQLQKYNRAEYQGQRTQSFEDQMLQFMKENKRVHTHEKNLQILKFSKQTQLCFKQTLML